MGVELTGSVTAIQGTPSERIHLPLPLAGGYTAHERHKQLFEPPSAMRRLAPPRRPGPSAHRARDIAQPKLEAR